MMLLGVDRILGAKSATTSQLLQVDRTFTGTPPMEARGCYRKWKTQTPEFARTGPATGSGPTQNTKDTERGRVETEREAAGPRKSVTMAPTSRYFTDRRYAVRKPLFSAEQQTSILKKSHAQERPEKEKPWIGSRTEVSHRHADMDLFTRPREEVIPNFLRRSQGTVSPTSTLEDLSSPLGVSDLRGRLSYEEPPFGSSYLGSRSARRNLSSPSLEVHTRASPLRPQLTSTVLSPTYIPHSRYSRALRAEFRLGLRAAQGETNTHVSPSRDYLKGPVSPALHTMSPLQANYWSCAIPNSLPPSPDRHSPGWDPDREYQALLDYTYPLRPGRVVSEWDSAELQGGSLLQTDAGFQDSGIELDHHCSSTSLSGLDFSLSGAGQTRERGILNAGRRSSERRGLSKSSEGLASGSPLSLTDPIGLSLESLDYSKDRAGTNHSNCDKGSGHYPQHRAPSSSTSAAFIRSATVLPRPRYVSGGEWDEEYRRLPDQLEEMQVLSRQVREVTAQLSQPVTASWESLEPGTTSILSSVTLPEKQEAEEEAEEGKEDAEISLYLTKGRHHVESSEAVRRSPGAQRGSMGGGLNQSRLRDVEALVEQLSDLALPVIRKGDQEDQEQTESLMQHIQIFCSNLEQLLRWLYTVLERMEVLAPPTVDIESVKSSLAEYQSFQREVSSHQPLTSSVLQTGEMLLNCISTTSPVLRDTLVLIERQSTVLETHTEHFFSSILSAMDSLTQPSQPSDVQETRVDDPGARVST
ncbi:centrosomal protein of 68 kDa [Diretmus argenteus]